MRHGNESAISADDVSSFLCRCHKFENTLVVSSFPLRSQDGDRRDRWRMVKEVSSSCFSGSTSRWRVETILGERGRRERGVRFGAGEEGSEKDLTSGALRIVPFVLFSSCCLSNVSPVSSRLSPSSPLESGSAASPHTESSAEELDSPSSPGRGMELAFWL